MKAHCKYRSGAVALAVLLSSVAVSAAEDHVLETPETLEWSEAPAVLPAGADAVRLFGDPTAEAPFALRLRFPDGYRVPPHTHPAMENVTVISGTLHLGMGEDPEADMQALPAGSFASMPSGMVHFVEAEGETVVQLNTTGPWGLTYVNPADDPRNSN